MISNIRYGNPYSCSLVEELNKLKKYLENNPTLRIEKNAPRMVMICGANLFTEDGEFVGLSKRREALKSFILNKYKNIVPIFAEEVFDVLDNQNLLNIEQYMLEFCDYIVIVLESYSSLCELGAFSHNEKLRKKLIIINDSRFKNANSYINEGPLRAVREENDGKSRLLWYKMINPSDQLDSISDIYKEFDSLLSKIERKKSSDIKQFDLDLFTDIRPDKANRTYLFLVHDMILLLEPITHKELIDLFKFCFGERSFDFLKFYLGMLNAMGTIKYVEKEGKKYYRALDSHEYIKHSYDYKRSRTIFRVFSHRYRLNDDL